ncbi:hypothetical protein B296_00042175 [Ensete ventricosum]|uniref:Uncharacterized protein n=1 Tax=Ensete ventricosum TaxID=4639 RepID=A0A426ZHF9_ENSVE|nr:hypothetical protein B296_00042175 [Ensete ventricosum]
MLTSSLLVPTSLTDLVVKNRGRLKKPSQKKKLPHSDLDSSAFGPVATALVATLSDDGTRPVAAFVNCLPRIDLLVRADVPVGRWHDTCHFVPVYQHGMPVCPNVLTRKEKRSKRKVWWRNRGGRKKKKKKKEEKCSDTWEATTATTTLKGSSSITTGKRQCRCSIATAKRQRGSVTAALQMVK